MKKRHITISFESNASDEAIEEIAEHMRWQLDSLTDGTLVDDFCNVCDDLTDENTTYSNATISIKTGEE